MMTFEQASKHLEDSIDEDTGLNGPGRLLLWVPYDDEVVLDGSFTIEDLEAIAVYVRHLNAGS
jgi:hypothetical protein